MPDVHYDERLRLELNGSMRRLRVVGRSSRSNYWLCEDIDSGRVLLLGEDKLRADARHDDSRAGDSS
jgi:hypothetical protein